eukprot:gene12679-16146_t
MGTTLVGSPDTVAKGIERLLGFSNGGFGGVLFRAHEWATREQTMRSYELFARYVMPRFQGSLDTIVNSNQWAKDNRKGIFGPNVAAVKKAFTEAAHVTRLEIVSNRIAVSAMEPRSAIGSYDTATERWTLHLGCQGVMGIRGTLAKDVLKVTPDKVHVLTGNVGGSFGMKSQVYPEYGPLRLASKKLGRPVKWTDE